MSRNPLRKWRVANGMTLADAALQLNVAMYTVQSWERGRFKPREESMASICSLVGTGTARSRNRLAQAWSKWWDERPSMA